MSTPVAVKTYGEILPKTGFAQTRRLSSTSLKETKKKEIRTGIRIRREEGRTSPSTALLYCVVSLVHCARNNCRNSLFCQSRPPLIFELRVNSTQNGVLRGNPFYTHCTRGPTPLNTQTSKATDNNSVGWDRLFLSQPHTPFIPSLLLPTPPPSSLQPTRGIFWIVVISVPIKTTSTCHACI